MKTFTSLFEAVQADELSLEELIRFYESTQKILTKELKLVLPIMIECGITSRQMVEDLVAGNKGAMMKIMHDNACDMARLQDLSKLLKGLGAYIYALPMMMDEDTRKYFMAGHKNIDDVALDLETEKGRTEVVRQFTPLMHKIVNQYIGKSSLSRSELISVALEGMVIAMNTYRKPDAVLDNIGGIDSAEAKKQKRASFKSHISYQMQYAILKEIHEKSRTVRLPQSLVDKNRAAGNDSANFNTVSIDSFGGSDDEDGWSNDHMSALGTTDARGNERKMESELGRKTMEQVFDFLQKNTSARNFAIFCKRFGLNGYKMMKPGEIAKEFNISSANLSMIIKDVTNMLKKSPKSRKLLQVLLDIYTESLIVDNYRKPANEILEAFWSDDTYLLLEQLTRYNTPGELSDALMEVLVNYDDASADFIKECLENDFAWLDDHYVNNKRLIIRFLEQMYPTESFIRKSDVYILETMNDLMEIFKEHKIIL